MVMTNQVYTRSGDDGPTVLGDGARLPEFHIRVAACGSEDEANSFIGLACLHVGEYGRRILLRIQNDLFDIGADLCRPERSGLKLEPLRVTEDQVRWLEEVLDAQNSKLEPLSSFVLRAAHKARACSMWLAPSCDGPNARSSRSDSRSRSHQPSSGI